MARSLSSPFREVIESFVLSRHDLREWTRRSYEKSLRRLECATLADFTEEMLDQHIEAKLKAKRLTTAHHDGIAAKQLGKWLVEHHILERDPVETVHVPKQPKKGRPPFKDEEVVLILDAARDSALTGDYALAGSSRTAPLLRRHDHFGERTALANEFRVAIQGATCEFR